VKGTDFLEKMELIHPEYVEEAAGHPRASVRRWVGWGAAAACICLLCLCIPGLLPDSAAPVLSSPLPGTPAPTSAPVTGPYSDLPALLARLSAHETHDDRNADGTPSVFSESAHLTQPTTVAINKRQTHAYHITDTDVQITRLNDGEPQPAGCLDVAAEQLLIWEEQLFLLFSCPSPDDPDAGSVWVCIYDISHPEAPVLLDEYVQRGTLSGCWLAHDALYLITTDGVCACGWSHLDDPTLYYPALSRNSVPISWDDAQISILGEPTRIQYSAITVIDGATRSVRHKQALYGTVSRIFYGADWLAACVSDETEGYRQSPLLYTFDSELRFTGTVCPADLLQDEPQEGTSLHIASVTMQDGICRIIGTCLQDTGEAQAQTQFLAMAISPETGEGG